MRIKSLIRFNLSMLVIIGLLFANIPNAIAQDGTSGEEYIGQVSVSTSKSLPAPKSILNLILPLANQPLPSGGTATATAGLAWIASRMDGIARSSLSADTVGTYNLCARVIQLYMNSAPQGGYKTPTCGDRIAGGSVSQTKSKIVASVFGKTWQVKTDHTFLNNNTGWSWYTPNSTSATP
ncbi:MAG: hypothetical protein AB1509_04200 [Chloroflexota bacterium]